MCGANKLTDKVELVLLLNEWTSLFSHSTSQRYVFMLPTRFVRTSGNNFNCLTKHGATLSSLNISRRTYCSGCDEHACDTIIFFRWKLKNQYLKSIVITFCKKRLSCDRVVKQGLGNLSTLVSTWLSVIKSDKSVFVAQAKHILNFPYDFRKLYLIDTR